MWTLNPDQVKGFNELRNTVVKRLGDLGLQPPEELLRGPGTDEELASQMALLKSEVAHLEEITWSNLSEGDKGLVAHLAEMLERLKRDGWWAMVRRLWLTGSFLNVPDGVDRYGYDPAFEEAIEPLLSFLFNEYWRIEVEGVTHIPHYGGAMLVANHAGLLPFDSLMIRYAVLHQHPTARAPRFLIEDWFYQKPVLSIIMNRIGFLRGCQENARALLDDGELIGVFPEGVQGISKLYRNRYRIRRFGRGGSVRLASEMGVPVIPVAVVGSEETYPVLWHSSLLARIMKIPFFPVTPQFPLMGPLGILPLPAAWSIRFCEPYTIELPGEDDAQYDIKVHTENEKLRDRVQEETATLYAARRSSFWH